MTTTKSVTERTNAYYDAVAEEYTAIYRERSPRGLAFELRRQRVLELFDRPGSRVLDVGCGPGVMVEPMRERGCQFVGVDPSTGMIEQCQRRFGALEDTRFFVGSAEQLDLPDASFDVVISMGVLERVQDCDAALRECIRVLVPGGRLIVTLANGHSPTFLWRDYVAYPAMSLARPIYYRLRGKPVPAINPGHTLYSPRPFANRIDAQGCDVTDIVYSGFPVLLSPLDGWFPRVAAACLERLERLRSTWMRGLGACFIIKAVKR